MTPTTTEFHRLYQNLLRFKLTDNPNKTYNRVTRTKRVNSISGGAAGGGMRKRLKQLINTQPNPLSLISTLHDMPVSPKWDNNIEYADYVLGDLPVFSSSMAGSVAAAANVINSVNANNINVNDDENQPNNIVILKISEYEKIKTSKYNLNDLKLLCGHTV
jgi:hypothetical protein